MEKDISGLKTRIETMLPILDERQRRIFLATEAKAIGYGGVSQISALSGVSRITITQGVKEIESGNIIQSDSRCRRKGGGRKSVSEVQPRIIQELDNLLDGNVSGNPMKPLMWTSKSLRNIEKALTERGFSISYKTVSEILKSLGFSLQVLLSSENWST
jgi:transposase